MGGRAPGAPPLDPPMVCHTRLHWRIQEFPDGWAPNPRGRVHQPIILAISPENCMNLKKRKRNVSLAPLGSTNAVVMLNSLFPSCHSPFATVDGISSSKPGSPTSMSRSGYEVGRYGRTFPTQRNGTLYPGIILFLDYFPLCVNSFTIVRTIQLFFLHLINLKWLNLKNTFNGQSKESIFLYAKI